MAVEGMEEESDLPDFTCSGQVIGLQILIQNLLSVKLVRVVLFHYGAKKPPTFWHPKTSEILILCPKLE